MGDKIVPISTPPVAKMEEPHRQSPENTKGSRDIGIPSENAQRRYFTAAFYGGNFKIKVANFFTWLRKTFTAMPHESVESPVGLAGVPNSWYNKIHYKAGAKELYLGRLPDNLDERQIPKNIRVVSVLMPFEAERIDSRIGRGTIVSAVDDIGMQPKEINDGVEALYRALSDTTDVRPVYLHCKSGVGRSATVLAAYLMKYQGMTLEQAIERVQRDRPDAQLREKRWFGGFKDTKHTRALKLWYFEQAAKEMTTFLGPTFAWPDAKKIKFIEFLEHNPNASPWIKTVVTGKPGSQEVMHAGAELLMLTQESEDEDLQQIGSALQQRSFLNTQFHTDGFPDIPFVPGELLKSGVMSRWNKNKAAFVAKKKIEDPDFQSGNAYLRKQLGILDAKPFWTLAQGPGMFDRHAGWIVEQVPTQGKPSKLELKRTLALMDGPRVRVASVDLVVDREMTLEEAQRFIFEMWKKAESPSTPDPQIFSKQWAEQAGRKFLDVCDERIEQMRQELVQFKAGDPEKRDLTVEDWSKMGMLYAGPKTD